jgi:hypothetical protein
VQGQPRLHNETLFNTFEVSTILALDRSSGNILLAFFIFYSHYSDYSSLFWGHINPREFII